MSLTSGLIKVSLDFAIKSNLGIVAVSYFDRSLALMKSIGASLNTETVSIGEKYILCNEEGYDTYITPVVYGKEKFFHAVSISKALNEKVLISVDHMLHSDFFNHLMQKFNLPLLYEWKDELYDYAIKKGYIKLVGYNSIIVGENHCSVNIEFKGVNVALQDLRVLDVVITEEELQIMVKELFAENKIMISPRKQKKLEFETMDKYFKNYGHTLVQKLEKTIEPLCLLSGSTNNLVLNNIRLYPQQIVQVNGVTALLKKSRYAILNMGMGTGKTICSLAIAEGFFVKKYLEKHSDMTLKDVYVDEKRIAYRNIVMCPGHLVQKWADEIKCEIPYSKVSIIKGLEQLVEVKQRGKERCGREWYIMSKDVAKLSYQSIPIPSKCAKKRIKVRVCSRCETIEYTSGFKCKCGSEEFHLKPTANVEWGMICPNCKELLLPNGKINTDNVEEHTMPLTPISFASPTSKNVRCNLCGTELWRPHIYNINTPGTDFYEHANKNSKWHRSTHYANKTHKSKKTVWVHSDYEDFYYSAIGERPLKERGVEDRGTRKYALAQYIKKQMKGFFDFFILDEAHLFKGGETAQGNAMQSLISASRYQLALTGTIAGGMATHLFYLLYRLDPGRMKKYGYNFKDELKFAYTYGTVKKIYEMVDESTKETCYNQKSKGRQIGAPKVKPGISPLIFRDFLLDKTVFLDLSDMSRFLPPLKEEVVTVDVPAQIEDKDGNLISNPEFECQQFYKQLIDNLKGQGVFSMVLQYSLSYLDKPYGIEPIRSPYTGLVLAEPRDYSYLIQNNSLLAKEKKLLEILREELSGNRNCVIYAEYTRSPQTCVTYRLKKIIQQHLHLGDDEVVIIETDYPTAAKREEWMHEKAEKGAKIFITNPRCVETGLDFCWMKNGNRYNYPTLIFYQLGYSLFTIWQASRRAYRLNQREECRTIYLAYAGTIQETVIALIAEKQVATSAIQGKFSTEGLSAMAQGVDVKLRLAQALFNLDNVSGNKLQEMFDVLNQDQAAQDSFTDYAPMRTFTELMGGDVAIKEETPQTAAVFDIIDNLAGIFNFNHFIKQYNSDKSSDVKLQEKVKLSKRDRQLMAAGQMSIF